jgi:hypothetical protein
LPRVVSAILKDGLQGNLQGNLGICDRLVLHTGREKVAFLARNLKTSSAATFVSNISPPTKKGNGRLILDAQKTRNRRIRNVLVDDAIVIRATLEQNYTFFTACTTPEQPTFAI